MPRAEELLAQALTQGRSPSAVAYQMVAEVARLKLPRPLKLRFEKEFKASLADPASAREVIDLLTTTLANQRAAVAYYGQKTHTKQVLTCADKARSRLEFTAAELAEACERLIDLDASSRTIKAYLRQGHLHFRTDPRFPMLEGIHLLRGAGLCRGLSHPPPVRGGGAAGPGDAGRPRAAGPARPH